MSLMTHPATLWLRGRLRKLGITKAIGRLWSNDRYEAVVENALLDAVHPNDIVWDVGANVGHYTLKLAGKVGTGGLVFAFEPSSVNLSKLNSNCQGQENIRVVPVGLSSQDSRLRIRQGVDELGATTRIELSTDGGVDTLPEIEVRRSDSVISSGMASPPNVLKIDVEGHEYDVLLGAGELLKYRALRAIIMEIHFDLLERSGQKDTPSQIEKLLNSSGFSTRWLDASHILASRTS